MPECSICLHNIKSNNLIETKCKHKFHKYCLKEWLKTNNTCPICREPIKRVYSVYCENYNCNTLLSVKNKVFGFTDIEREKFNKIFLYNNLQRIKLSKKKILLRIKEDSKMVNYIFKSNKNNLKKIFILIKYQINKIFIPESQHLN